MRSKIEKATDFSMCTKIDLSTRDKAYRAAGNFFIGENLDHLGTEAFEQRLWRERLPAVLYIDARDLSEDETRAALGVAVDFLHGWYGMSVRLLVDKEIDLLGVTDASKLTHSFWS